MAVNTRGPDTHVTPSVVYHSAHAGLRSGLVALAALTAFTAIQGAIFVVPTLPLDWLHKGLVTPFTDYTIPALALGVLCGGAALLALVTVLLRPRLGGLVSLVAGVLMIGFELVEIAVVGFTPVLDPTQPQSWLQVFYLVVGALLAALGVRLWRVEVDVVR